MTRASLYIALAIGLTAPAVALDLPLPPVAQTVLNDVQERGEYDIATGAWREDAGVETLAVAGILNKTVWRIAPYTGTVSQLLAPIEEMLTTEGYQTRLRCQADVCGGFDFRFARDVPREPVMHVDLGNYIYLSAERAGDDGVDYIEILASRGGQGAYLYVAQVGPAAGEGSTVTLSTRSPDLSNAALPVAEQLLTQGRASLDDLVFDTGLSSLSGADYPVLTEIAEILQEDPTRRVTFVGHTDAQGSLDANIALSRARADAVRLHLVDRLGVAPEQVAAEGVGYLAPRAVNATEEGRQANRRVEAILLNTE